jgi:putative ABC transport system permease protein
MEKLIQDILYSLRSLFKNRGFAIVALIMLALGIGANTVIFSIVNAVLLRSLPFKDPDRIVYIWNNNLKESNDHNTVSLPDFQDWKSQSQNLEAMSGYAMRAYNMSGTQEPEPVQGVAVLPDFFRVLGVEPAVGRSFRPDEDREKLVILSDSLWQRRFKADPNIIGQAVTLSSASYTVVGIMPPGFTFPRADVEAWTTFSPLYSLPPVQRRGFHFLRVIGRVKPGVSMVQARTEMSAIAGRLEQQYPDTNVGLGTNIVSIRGELLGDSRPRLLLIWAAGGFVLLITCANLANLLMARTTTREKEIAIRSALGASRVRVIRQLLTESVLLSLIGGLLGLLVAVAGLRLLISLNPGNIPRMETASLDATALLFTFVISLLTGVIFGVVPALQATRLDLNSVLKEGGRGTGGSSGRRRRMQNIVVISEVALSLVLLVGAGLMLRSFLRLSTVSLGFEPTKVLSMYLAYSTDKYPERPQQYAFLRRITDGLEQLPGVESASIGMSLPPESIYRRDEFVIEGRPQADSRQKLSADFLPVSAHYFRTLQVPLLKGREFTDADKEDAPQVVVINQTLARREFQNEDPIGKRINLGEQGEKESQYEIVGVVGDVKYTGLNASPKNQLYFSYLQQGLGGLFVFVRTSGDPASMKPAIRKQVFAVDFEQPVRELRTMEETLSETLAQQRFNVLLLIIFAALALTLTAVGIYGVIAYSVSQRSHEIGVRMALGAKRKDVSRLVVKLGLKLVAIGVVIGLFAAFALTRIIASLLYGVSATDPITFGLTAALLGGVALLASVIPARRATRVEPIVVLRQE